MCLCGLAAAGSVTLLPDGHTAHFTPATNFSGTAALHCALTALEVGPGDEVILPAWTWYSCYNAILLTGALPVFSEVDDSFNIDPHDMERRITPNTKAIMAAQGDRINPLYGLASGFQGPRSCRLQIAFFF